MEQNIIVTGMILSASFMGEYDKRLVILTRERGKITVFAKGARRQNSVLLAKTNPFSFGRFTIIPGRNTYHMRHAEIDNYFWEMTRDYERACYGFYFLEYANYYTREGNDEVMMLKLLYQSMRALLKPSLPLKLVRYIFELKAIVVNGECPRMFECFRCGGKVESGYFIVRESGVVCAKCSQVVSDGIFLEQSVLYTMQYVITANIEKLYTFVVSNEVLLKFQKVMDVYRKYYTDRRFKTLDVLEGNEKVTKEER